MKLHEIHLKGSPRQIIYGYISRVDYRQEAFYVLGKDQIGMLGRDGTRYRFDEVDLVLAEERPGQYAEDQLSRWRHYGKTHYAP